MENVFYTTIGLVTVVEHNKKILNNYPSGIGFLGVIENWFSSMNGRRPIDEKIRLINLIWL